MARFEEFVESIDEQPLHIKIAILVVIVVLISGLYWYFIWSPKAEELKRAKTTLNKLESKLEEYEAIAKDLPKFEAEFERLKKEFDIAALKLPQEKEIPALIDGVYSAVSAAGLEPITFVPKGEVRKDIYAEIPIEMKVSGSYFELANFFHRVSRLPRIVNVRNLEMKRDSQKSKGANIKLDVEFTTVTFRLLPVSLDEMDGERQEGRKRGKRKT
ncbi:type 4a pilus biogenesis protein PilO [Desulfobacterota bacterium AH_259_B03_O07]|nr:type 4a pilus biogenesis protein PilO [Desulfobacterota bacterium AH_259_B03_O07]